MIDGPLLPCVSPHKCPKPGCVQCPIPEPPRHRAGVGAMALPSATPQREQGQGTKLRFAAALRPALALAYKAKIRSFTGLQLSLTELSYKNGGGGQDYEPCGLVLHHSHAGSICNKKKLASKTAAVSREWSLLLQAVIRNTAPEGLHFQGLIHICSPCSVSKVTPPNSLPKSPSLVTPAHALPPASAGV